ncbi:MAG: ANTAR domain-containing protein [Nocardioidaceae bacterium]
MEKRESWLADAMIELADSLEMRESAYLNVLARRLAELVAPAEIGLLVTTDTGSLTTPAASTQRMRDLMAVESSLKEGPCTTSHGTGQQLRHQTLDAVDGRWPRFGPAAREAGFAAVSAYPMRRRTELFGAVSVLDPGARSADDLPISLVSILAEVAAIGLSHQRTYRQSQRRVEQLQRALHSRVVIEQAKGIVAAWREITPDEAFELLRNHARRNGHRLNAVAEEIVHGRLTDEQIEAKDRQPDG